MSPLLQSGFKMIIPLKDYKDYLGINSNEFDSILKTVIEGSEYEVQSFLGYSVVSEEHEDIYDGSGKSYLDLENYPVTEVTKVEYWDGVSWVELIEGEKFSKKFMEKKYILHLEGYTFEEGFSNYRITFKSGLATIPAQLAQAMKRLCKIRWDETPFGKNTLGVSSINDSGGVTHSVSISKDDERKIFKSIERHARINV